MLSIIICLRTKEIPHSLERNLKETVGIKAEIIWIDNSRNEHSIFEAYNLGIKKSKGEILCFLHDDISIHTQNWGREIKNIFASNSKVGIVGIAGAKMKTRMPSAWWDCPQPYRAANILQHVRKETIEHWDYGFSNSVCEEVVVVDGVFMAVRKENRVSFNEELKGFHNYDVSLCIDYRRIGYSILVTRKILLEHQSLGNLNRQWYESSNKLYDIYKNHLPAMADEVSEDVILRQEISNGKHYIEGLLKERLVGLAFKFWLRLLKQRPLSKNFLFLLKTLLSK